MKFSLIAASAAAALAIGSQTALAQPIVVQPSGGLTIGGTIYGRGIALGGAYSTGPVVGPVVAAPRIYAGPVVVPVAPVVPVLPYGYGYARPYYPPYGYHHHHYYRR
jgi:hypothetical protein